MVRSLVLILACAAGVRAQQYTIYTIAGGGPDGAPAATASLRSPAGMALNGAGNLFVSAGRFVNRVYAIDTTNWMSVYAGTGEAGTGGDSVWARNGLLSSPAGLALDASGNLFVADTNNHRIRKISTGGVILTVAGTGAAGYNGEGVMAASAQFHRPVGLAIDSSGNLYVADSANHRVRKIAGGSGAVTTIAGTGTAGFAGDGGAGAGAQLSLPTGVAVDSSGNVYIADSMNHRIRKVAAGTGVITTVAGSGTAGFAGDGGAATAAQLNEPKDVAADAAGNLYIADSSNHRVRKVTPGGNISTLAGSGTAGFSGDGAAAAAAALNYPSAVMVDSGGAVYIADFLNRRVRKVTAGGTISTVAGNGSDFHAGDGWYSSGAALNGPCSLTRDGSGNIFIADMYNHRVRIALVGGGRMVSGVGNGSPGSSGDNGPAAYATVNGPAGVATGTNGNIYIADSYNHRVRRFQSGNLFAFAGNGAAGFSGDGAAAVSAQLNTPSGVAADSAGNVYIADTFNHRIRKITASGTITTIAGTGTAGFSGDGGQATGGQLRYPYGVSVDANGNVYIADTLNHRIRKVSTSGILSTVAGTGAAGFNGDSIAATSALLNFPAGITTNGSGSILYIADTANHRIRRVTGGNIETVVGTGAAGFNGDGPGTSTQLSFPACIVVDLSGSLYICDTTNGRIRYGLPSS